MSIESDKAAGLETTRERLEERLRRLGEIRAQPMHRAPRTIEAIVAEANALSGLVVADEIAGLRADLAKVIGKDKGQGSISDQVGWALDRITSSISDMAHNLSSEAMRHRPS